MLTKKSKPALMRCSLSQTFFLNLFYSNTIRDKDVNHDKRDPNGGSSCTFVGQHCAIALINSQIPIVDRQTRTGDSARYSVKLRDLSHFEQ